MSGLLTKKFIREEEDGSITNTYAMECKGILKTHNSQGPAIENKEQKIKEYYLYGVRMKKEEWYKKRNLS